LPGSGGVSGSDSPAGAGKEDLAWLDEPPPDELTTEDWIAERNARIAKKKEIAAAEARARAKNSTAIGVKK